MFLSLRQAIEREEQVKIVGEVVRIQGMRETAVSLSPHVVLLDLSMTKMADLNYIDDFCRQHPQGSTNTWPPALLALSAYFDREFICRLFAIGVKGYLLIDEPADQIAAGIIAAATTSLVLSSSVRATLQSPRRQTPFLSVRSASLLAYVARGYTDAEIGRLHDLEIKEVENQLQALLQGLPGVSTRSDAVSWAWEHGIAPPSCGKHHNTGHKIR